MIMMVACKNKSVNTVKPPRFIQGSISLYKSTVSGSANFSYQVQAEGDNFRFSVLNDHNSDYIAGERSYLFTSQNENVYTFLTELFRGGISIEVNRGSECSDCLTGFFSSDIVIKEGTSNEVQVKTNAFAHIMDLVINQAYIQIFPFDGDYTMVNRYCKSGDLPNDTFSFITDEINLSFDSVGSQMFVELIEDDMVTTQDQFTYSISEETLKADNTYQRIEIVPKGLNSGVESFSFVESHFIGQTGSCVEGDQFVSEFVKTNYVK